MGTPEMRYLRHQFSDLVQIYKDVVRLMIVTMRGNVEPKTWEEPQAVQVGIKERSSMEERQGQS